MPNLSQYTEDAILNWFKGTTFPSAPAAIYVDLLDAASASILTTIAGSANRQIITWGAISTDGTGRKMLNDAVVTFTNAALAPGTYQYVAFYDAITGGNQLTKESVVLTPVGIGDKVQVAVGNSYLKID